MLPPDPLAQRLPEKEPKFELSKIIHHKQVTYD